MQLINSLEHATLNGELLEKIIPFLDIASKETVVRKIIEGESDWRLLTTIIPYIEDMTGQLEAAFVDGALPKEAQTMINEYWINKNGRQENGMNIFKCTKCGGILDGFIPSKCVCGYTIPIINGVHQFTDDAPISADGDGLKWLGYEYVGENYRPDYFYNRENEKIGNYNNLAEFMGTDKIILDVGAGLGEQVIAFSLSGFKAIAADISQVMLETAVIRARKHNTPENKIIFTRMNGYKLELADNSVDAVLADDVLHQVDKPELMMGEILRVLKPDGYFLGHGGGKNLGFTAEQEEANARYNEICTDIQDFYDNLIAKAGYGKPKFHSHEKAAQCVTDNFTAYKPIDDTGAWWRDNSEWPLKWGLRKQKPPVQRS